MFPASRARLAATTLNGLLLAGLLPTTALAAVPVAHPDSYTVGVNAAVTTFDVLANDTDADAGDTLTVNTVSDPAHGTTPHHGSDIDYTPDTGFHGTDTFQDTVKGVALGVSAPATVTVIVNDGPMYTPHANAHGTDSFTYTLSDGAGSHDTPKVTLSIAATNLPPDGTDGTVSTNIDVPYVFGTADFGFTDPDDVPANNFAAVTITTVPANGSLEIDGGPVLAGDSISVADLVAGKLAFTPGAGEQGLGYATFTFQVQDDGGVADGGIDLDPTPNTMSIDVVPNHAPAGTDDALTTLEDAPLPLTVADFGFTDPDDTPANDLLAVKIATLPLAGSLADDGNAVSAGDVIPVADVIGNKLVFTPAANASGDDYAAFTFQVQDDGGTGGGGADIDLSANTLTIAVTPLNDAPSGTDTAITGVEDIPKTIGAGDFGFSDVNDSPPDTLAAVRITTLPGSGTLKDGTVAVSAGDVVPVADILANQLAYVPAANANGNPLTTFTFQVKDGGGTLDGGVDLDPTPNTLTINVTPVNDAPHAGNDTGVNIPESAGPTSIAVLANDTDVDGDTLEITSVTQGGHGAVAITGGGTGLTYDPAQLYVGTDTFKYTIDDSHGGTFQATVLVAVVRDTTKPTVSGLAESFSAQTVATSTTGETISWSGSDAGSGIAKFELQVSVNGGAYTSIALATLTSTSINRAQADDTSYRYRVRATDKEGNVSAWLNGPPWRLGRVQDDSASIVYTGSWVASADPSALGGSHRSASSSSDRASIKLSVRDFAWVATKTATSGSAEVWIDGVLDSTIDLHSSATTFRQLVFSHRFSTLGTHTVEIRPVGDGPIDLDAFLIVREPFLGVGSPPRSTS
jgi:hypothetical protein